MEPPTPQAPVSRRVQSIDSYLAVLDGELGGRSTRRAQLLTDVRGHLEDSVTEITENGYDRGAAEAIAIERFGDPIALAHQLQTTPALAYEEGIRSVSLGLFALYAVWTAGLAVAVTPTALTNVFPLAVALTSFPVGLGLRLWERQRHMRGLPVPGAVTACNGAVAGQTLRVVAAIGLVAMIFSPLARYWQWGPAVYAAGLALAAGAWFLLSWWRRPTATTVKVRRRVGGVMLAVVTVPLGLYAVLGVAAFLVPSYDVSDDVQLIACESDESTDTITATVRITNHDDTRHGYALIPEVVQGNRSIASLTRQAWQGPQLKKESGLRNAAVRPGQTVTVEYYGKVGRIPDHFTCQLDDPQTVKDATSLLH